MKKLVFNLVVIISLGNLLNANKLVEDLAENAKMIAIANSFGGQLKEDAKKRITKLLNREPFSCSHRLDGNTYEKFYFIFNPNLSYKLSSRNNIGEKQSVFLDIIFKTQIRINIANLIK